MNDISNETVGNVNVNTVEKTSANGDNSVAQKAAAKSAAMAKMSHAKSSTNGKAASVAKRQPIGDGETATRSIEILSDRVVKASYTFKLNDADKQRYGVVTTLDYSNCSMAEILELATRSNVITLQRNLRQMGDGAMDASVYQKIDVKRDLLDAQRSTMDGDTRDLHAFARVTKMSMDDARRILAKIADGSLKLK